MSVCNLKLEYPELNKNWAYVNTDKTLKCPGNWIITENSEFERYFPIGEIYYQVLEAGETIQVPFKTNDLSFLSNKNITFNHFVNGTDVGLYTIVVWFNDVDFQVFSFSDPNIEYSRTFECPSNTEYIRFEGVTNYTLFLDVDFDFDFQTVDFDINTEQNNVSIAPNIVSNITLANTVTSTKVKKTETSYTSELILSREEEEDIDDIVDLARLNRLLVSTNINIAEEAGNTLANLPAGGLENWVKYYYINHETSERTGLYKYVNLSYKSDVDSTAIYF